MAKHLKSPALWSLVLWFYLGSAYLSWSVGAAMPLPSGPPHYVVSPELDPIIGSWLIIGPLLLLCGLPVFGISQLLVFIANSIVSLWHGTSYSPADVRYLSPLITALVVYLIYRPVRRRWPARTAEYPYQ